MPAWIDLTDHDVALNVVLNQDGKVLILRPLNGTPIPRSVTAMGFEPDGDLFKRENLRFTLQEIQEHFPKARAREFSMPDIFFTPSPSVSEPDVPLSADPEVRTWSFASKRRNGTRPAGEAAIRVMEVDGNWFNALDIRHHHGNMAGQLEPLSTSGTAYESEFDALFAAGNRIIDHANHVLIRADSMVTDRQRAVATEMAEWAHHVIMPAHEIAIISAGVYKNWTRAVVTSGDYRGAAGVGKDIPSALAKLRQRIGARHSFDETRQWTVIGVNDQGQAIKEDGMGVRAIESGILTIAESVILTPNGPMLPLERRSKEYLTVEELRDLRAESQPMLNSGADDSEAVAVMHRVGDVVAGAEIHLLVDAIPVTLFRRKLSKYDPRSERRDKNCTYARALIAGSWQSLGEPWLQARPSNAELRTAINYVTHNPVSFDGDALLAEVAAEIASENLTLIDSKFRRDPPSPSIFSIFRVDDFSFELRFKDTSQPFAMLIEYHSPGVFVPTFYKGGNGSQMAFANAVCWAARQMSSVKAQYAQALMQQTSHALRIECSKASFVEVFGAQRKDAEASTELREKYFSAGTLDRDAIPKFMRDDELVLPDDFSLNWIDSESVIVTRLDRDHSFSVEIVGNGTDPRGRSAKNALGTAMVHISGELKWAREKAGRSDNGHQLESIAYAYTTFLHERHPTHHSGAQSSMHREFAMAITDKNVDRLNSWLARPPGQNDLSKKFFALSIGKPLPKSARDIKAAIYSWAGYLPEDAAARELSMKIAREAKLLQQEAARAFEHTVNVLENTRVNHDGQLMNMREFLDEVIARGYDRIETTKRGAVDRYRLANKTLGRMYELKGSMVDYVRHTLHLRQEANPDLQPVEDEELKYLFRPG